MAKDLMELVESCDVSKAVDGSRIPEARATAEMLTELGFNAAAEMVTNKFHPMLKMAEIAAGRYIEITPEKIQAFLNRKAAEYDKCRKAVESQSDDSLLRAYVNSKVAELQNGLSTAINTGIFSTTTWTNVGQPAATGQLIYGYGDGVTIRPMPSSFSAYTKDSSSSRPGTIGKFQWSEAAVAEYPGVPPINVLRKFKEEKKKKVFDYFTVATVNAVPDPLLLGRIQKCSSRWFLAQWGEDVKLDDII